MRIIKRRLSFIVILFLSTFVSGQGKFPNTLFLDGSTQSPKADLSNIEWIEGYWRGEAFGGITEKVWTPRFGGSMMAAFKLVINNQVKFYELVTIVEKDSSLILRLKHFSQDLKGWEEKDDSVDFELVKVTDNRVYFDGFTFERKTKNEINLYVVLQNEGEKNEVKFNYKKVIK